ncbi:MAG: hypothetical protein RMJ84_10560 [Sandaracinaceae bacterium]|nr:hypothetical protein [Sandaracinaceae bacterium]
MAQAPSTSPSPQMPQGASPPPSYFGDQNPYPAYQVSTPSCYPPPRELRADARGNIRCMEPRQVHHVDGAWLGSGIALFTSGYASNLIFSLIIAGTLPSDRQKSFMDWGLVPVFGPLIQSFYEPSPGWLVLLFLHLGLQTTGFAFIVLGIAGRDDVVWKPVKEESARLRLSPSGIEFVF